MSSPQDKHYFLIGKTHVNISVLGARCFGAFQSGAFRNHSSAPRSPPGRPLKPQTQSPEPWTKTPSYLTAWWWSDSMKYRASLSPMFSDSLPRRFRASRTLRCFFGRPLDHVFNDFGVVLGFIVGSFASHFGHKKRACTT